MDFTKIGWSSGYRKVSVRSARDSLTPPEAIFARQVLSLRAGKSSLNVHNTFTLDNLDLNRLVIVIVDIPSLILHNSSYPSAINSDNAAPVP